MQYKTIVIDDSSIQRLATECLVKNHPKLELLGSYANPYEGVRAAIDEDADILFLDILMGDVDAFELMDIIEITCPIILNSTWADFAVRAFDYDVADFLTKPIKPSRFERSVEKVIGKIPFYLAATKKPRVYFWNTELSEFF